MNEILWIFYESLVALGFVAFILEKRSSDSDSITFIITFSSFQLSRNPRHDQLHFILFNFLPVLFREVSMLHTMEMLMRARSWSDHDPQKKNFSLSVFMLGNLSIHIFIIWGDAVEMPYSKTKQGQKDYVIMLMLQERRCLQLFWR